MATPRLYGPLPLTPERVDRHLQASSPGVYALGEERDGLFVIGQVGRSDRDLRAALTAEVGRRFTHFKFRYALSAEDAFRTECDLFHAVSLKDSIHPTAPEGTWLQCTRCHSVSRDNALCPIANQLFDVYCTALTEFHDVRPPFRGTSLSDSSNVEREAFARLKTARRQYWSHVTEHGCRPPVGASASRIDMERHLRVQMREARREFVTASDQFDELIGIALDSRGTADGFLAREQAKRLRDAAFQRYDEALRQYAEFVVGKTE